ncbi:MAG TPA: hypothetical protein VI011_05795 [Asanoa sp.]
MRARPVGHAQVAWWSAVAVGVAAAGFAGRGRALGRVSAPVARPAAPANNASNSATRGAVGVQAGTYVLNVFDGDHDATYAQRVRRCVSG